MTITVKRIMPFGSLPVAAVEEVANYNTALRQTHKPVTPGSYWGHKL